MKAKIIFASLVALTISSCTTIEEKKYKKKEWEIKTKNLDLEYKQKCIELKTNAEIELLIRWADSIANNSH